MGPMCHGTVASVPADQGGGRNVGGIIQFEGEKKTVSIFERVKDE